MGWDLRTARTVFFRWIRRGDSVLENWPSCLDRPPAAGRRIARSGCGRETAVLATLPADKSRWLVQYAQGVNDGLSSLASRPFEYWLLRGEPARWLPEDSLLVSASMAWQLQAGEISAEKFWLALGAAIEKPEGGDAAQARSVAIAHLLSPRPTEWDAPLASVTADGGDTIDAEPELPTPEQWDLRALRSPAAAPPAAAESMAAFDAWQEPRFLRWPIAGVSAAPAQRPALRW